MANLRKHRIGSDRAAEIFLDPLATSIFDEEHSEHEERWISLGKDGRGNVLALIHTFSEISADECNIRITSARKANRRETKQYEETKP